MSNAASNLSEPVASEPQSLELKRTFPASCEQLYRCFIDREHVAQWFGPTGVTCTDVAIDARPGGQYRIAMANAAGNPVVVLGRFLELDPPRKICMTWAWESQPQAETRVTVRFDPVGDGSLLTLRHEQFETASASRAHTEGWESSFDCLAAHLGAASGADGA